jgi:hypothetical protein
MTCVCESIILTHCSSLKMSRDTAIAENRSLPGHLKPLELETVTIQDSPAKKIDRPREPFVLELSDDDDD